MANPVLLRMAAETTYGGLIEIGFEGGHGTAAGMADTFADLGFEEGADLALGLAFGPLYFARMVPDRGRGRW